MSLTRRVLVAHNNTINTNKVLLWKRTPARRVYLTQSKPPPGAPQHVRGYKNSLQNPYFVANPVLVVEPEASTCYNQQQQHSFWQQAFRWYSDKLTTHPLLTKSLTGAVIAAGGDVLCQAGTYQRPPQEEDNATSSTSFWRHGWDVRRSFHFFLLGLTFVAPTSHYWYGNLAVHPFTKGQSLVQITKRVVLDQFVWTPVFFVIWLGGFWTLEKNGQVTAHQIQSDLTTHLPDVMVANWLLWIPAQYLNFYACPVKFQVLFTNIVELVWNAYLSFATSSSSEGGGHGSGGHGSGSGSDGSNEEKKDR